MQSPDMNPLNFQERLLKLSEQLNADQLGKMLFICDFIGRAIREKITTGYELFEILMQRRKISADDTSYLRWLLVKTGRQDLSDTLSDGAGNCGASPEEHNDAEGVKINLAAEVIAKHLGRNWRKLGRKLRLSEVKLQNIDRKKLDLEDVTMEMIQEWRTAKGCEASVEQLLVALKECQLLLIAEKVEEELAKEQ